MSKKGFTLVEIIICISLIVVIGLGSFFAVKFISNKELIERLEQITDRAVNAAQVYIETNKETYNQLYNNKNGVSLPLQLLVKEGLLNLDNTELTESDIEDQYVITFLGSTSSSDSCEQITSTTSWGNDKEIYLCLNSDGSSNLSILDPNNLSNLNKVKRERYYFRGGDAGSRNYVKYENKMYQIYYVDTDDTLVLYSKSSFGNTFNGKTLPVANYNVSSIIYGCKEDNSVLTGVISSSSSTNGETVVNFFDIFQTSLCFETIYEINFSSLEGWMDYELEFTSKIWGMTQDSTEFAFQYWLNKISGYKIHLNDKFEITSGTGDYANPYILEYNN